MYNFEYSAYKNPVATLLTTGLFLADNPTHDDVNGVMVV